MTVYISRDDSDALAHYGVLGMKWGVRRTPEQLGHNKSAKDKLRTYKSENISEKTIEYWKKDIPRLRHVRLNKNTQGRLYSKNGKLVAMINTENKDGVIWIQGLEVFGDAQGKGLGTALLDTAVKDFKATHLSVNRKNARAKMMYDKYGFKTYKSDRDMYYMSIK